MEKIGIFGGSFNPPHVGHLLLASLVFEKLKLNKLLFIPAFIPPHKTKLNLIEPEHRLKMLKFSIGSNNCFEVLDIEIKRGGKSYTFDTLMYLKKIKPEAKFYLIIGYDNYIDFTSWKNYKELLKNCKVVVLNRYISKDVNKKIKHCENYSYQKNHILSKENFIFINNPIFDISSTEIRKRVSKGKSISYYVTEKVARYIERNKLYR